MAAKKTWKRKPREGHLETQISLRLPAADLERVEALLPLVEADGKFGPLGPWDRARVIRLCLGVGIGVVGKSVRGDSAGREK